MDKNLFLFVHIEKCGGTTFHHILLNNFGISYIPLTAWFYWGNSIENRFQSKELGAFLRMFPFLKGMGGHSLSPCLGYDSKTNKNIRYMTFFRDPVKRYISQYYHQKETMRVEWTWEEYLKDTYFNNFMVKKIAGEENLEKAKKIVDDFFFVGFMERYNESIVLLKELFSDIYSGFDVRYERLVTGEKKKKNPYEIGKKDLEKVKKNNKLDIELYNYAYKNFLKKIDNIPDFNKKLKEFSDLNEKFSYSKIKRKIWVLYKIIYQFFEYIITKNYHNKKVSARLFEKPTIPN